MAPLAGPGSQISWRVQRPLAKDASADNRHFEIGPAHSKERRYRRAPARGIERPETRRTRATADRQHGQYPVRKRWPNLRPRRDLFWFLASVETIFAGYIPAAAGKSSGGQGLGMQEGRKEMKCPRRSSARIRRANALR